MKTYTLLYTPEAHDGLRALFSYTAYHLHEKERPRIRSAGFPGDCLDIPSKQNGGFL